MNVEPTMLADCVLQSASFSGPIRPQLIDACFGLSPEFSTPVEKTVENRGLGYEPLGKHPRPYRNKGEPAQFLHLVPADLLPGRGRHFRDRASTKWPVRGMADQ